MPVGSLTTFGGTTELSGIGVRSGAAVFPGDTIKTGPGSALFTLSGGKTIRIGANSEVRVGKDSSAVVEILKGMSRMSSKSEPVTMLASNWRLQGQPDSTTGLLTVDVVRESDGKVSLNVASGQVVARSDRGEAVMVAQVGRPVMLPASMPAAPDTPQAGGGSSKSSSGTDKAKVLAYLIGAAGIGLGVAALASREDNTDLRTQLASLSTRNAALSSQITSLSTQLQAVAAAAQSIKGLSDQLNAVLQQLNTAQSQLATIQSQINTLVAKVASGQPLSAAEQAQLTSLQQQQATLAATVSSAASRAQTIINQISSTPIPSVTLP